YRGRHHVAAPAGKRGWGGWGDPSVRRRHRHLHHARLSFPRGRWVDDQFPSAEIDPVHAGERDDGAGADAGRLCPCHRGGISLLFLWRCLAAAARTRCRPLASHLQIAALRPICASVTDLILDIRGLAKTYKAGTTALAGVDLQIRRGEIFALLGPNGAGKTTLIGAVCGLLRPTGGTIEAFGLDVARNWRQVRQRIGLVPQELSFDMFERVDHSVAYSRGMFGC